MRERIRGAELTVIEGQRHFSNVEVADEFNRILRAGLDEMSAGGRRTGTRMARS
jgi:pimeloyl-ACP methyl ester carboxylesterase